MITPPSWTVFLAFEAMFDHVPWSIGDQILKYALSHWLKTPKSQNLIGFNGSQHIYIYVIYIYILYPLVVTNVAIEIHHY